MAAHYDALAPRQTLVTIHVYSGLAMGVLVVIHFLQYTTEAAIVLLRGESLRERFPMLEIYTAKFLRDLWAALVRPFKPSVKPGPYGKYNPEQLFEYWGVYWGIAILGIPGFAMIFTGPSALDGLLWVMHFKEAILAITFILMVHIAYTHFRPTVFPVDTVIFTGRMPLERAEAEHPLWAARLKPRGKLLPAQAPKTGAGKAKPGS
jgi:cytochrome b subunit of formate dehydrogenase